MDGGTPDTPSVCPGGCDGGVCVQSMCCPEELACGNKCCAQAEVCAFGSCVTPGDECVDSSDCGKNAYCDFAIGSSAQPPMSGCHGAVRITGRCLPEPAECPPDKVFDTDEVVDCLVECKRAPIAAAFELRERYAWTEASVIALPVVTELDDDNCDGRVTERDIPDIVFVAMNPPEPPDMLNPESHNGSLVAMSIVGGKVIEKWNVHPTEERPHPGQPLAAAELDGKPGAEIVYCADTGQTVVVGPDGAKRWSVPGNCRFPAIGDLDQDGSPEVITPEFVLDGRTGAEKGVLALGVPALADLDADGALDIVGPSAAVRSDGSTIAMTALVADWNAIGDLDKDGVPEVVAVQARDHVLAVWHLDASAPGGATVVRQDVDLFGKISPTPKCSPISVGSSQGGGPPTIADVNGDGYPDVATATGASYTVFDGKKLMDPKVLNTDTLLWQQETQDCTSAGTGSSVFDFSGDGSAEVVYGDELYFRIYRGKDGKELYRTCNTTATLWEYPVVADVDADGHADVVVVANDHRASEFTCPDDGSTQRGVRVFSDTEGRVVRTRNVWNEHTYHVTNVEEDGTVPTNEAPNWSAPDLNNFRQNRARGGGDLFLPDLVASVFPACHGMTGLVARVRNIGRAFVPAGVPVGFYAGEPGKGGTPLGTVPTTVPLYPAQAQDVFLALGVLPMGVVYAVVDDGAPAHAWTECNTENNRAGPVGAHCVTVW